MSRFSASLAPHVQGLGRTAHSPKHGTYGPLGRTAHSPKHGTYGPLGRTTHDPRKQSTYGVTFRAMRGTRGAWGDWGRSVLGDLVTTGRDWFTSRNPPAGGGATPPVVVIQQPPKSWEWPKWTPWAVGAAVVFFMLRGFRGRGR